MTVLRLFVLTVSVCSGPAFAADDTRPNVLIMISDDVSWPHASAYGSKMVDTPVFDQVAERGILFDNAFCCAPGCSPSRAALLTGRHIWMIEEAGTHASYFKTQYQTFPERLAAAGYFTGSVGKGWAPGNFVKNGRQYNPAGRSFGRKGGYIGGFQRFLKERPQDQPFCFWFGSSDAHRSYVKGSGLKKGKTLKQAEVPGFLPDRDEIRSDLLDYAFEVERFDEDCGKMLAALEDIGELQNTLVIITSDNGMPFPRAKANCYEYGIHMPLAIQWPQQFPGGRRLSDLVSFTDLTATIYEATGCEPPTDFSVVGRSLVPMLQSEQNQRSGEDRSFVLSGRERHSSSRFNSLGYPQRALRTQKYLYIYNFRPERAPAGPAQKFDKATFDSEGRLASGKLGQPFGGYHDIDACPTLTFLIEQQEDPNIDRYLQLAVAHRPAEELFNILEDPDCLHNLAPAPQHEATRSSLHDTLMQQLKSTGDARVLNGGDVWETYPRVSGLRWFPAPAWVQQARDSGRDLPQQDWVDERRPRAQEPK
ncbi:MAG: sulfatase [Planctomycetaceae bacterium]|nr:sulfatase [Planctomycetaceae bacterium]